MNDAGQFYPWFNMLYHRIKNTANKNTGKPLYISRYYAQPSNREPNVSH